MNESMELGKASLYSRKTYLAVPRAEWEGSYHEIEEAHEKGFILPAYKLVLPKLPDTRGPF